MIGSLGICTVELVIRRAVTSKALAPHLQITVALLPQMRAQIYTNVTLTNQVIKQKTKSLMYTGHG